MEHGLRRWRDRWTAAGFPAIPLRPFAKAPMCRAWQLRPPGEQWSEAGGRSFRGNVGVVTGEGLAVVDCDAPETVQSVEMRFDAMNLHPPAVKTASGDGRHFYIRIEDAPDGNYTTLDPDVGPGELRYGPGAYVVAPCSQVDGNRYAFERGSPERIARMKPLRWRDLQWLIDLNKPAVTLDLEAPPVRLVRWPMPEKANTLLQVLAKADGPTRPFYGYQSRSEAEAAVVAMLILAGWSQDEISSEFAERRPGHFAEHARPDWYLRHTYADVLADLASTPERLEIARAYREAANAPWPGRSGARDRVVYLGLLAACWSWGTWEVRVSQRALAEYTAASRRGVRSSLTRLQKDDLVTKVQPWQWHGGDRRVEATTWKLGQCTITTPVSHSGDAVSAQSACVVECGVEGAAELWARGGLGRSAGLVYRHLSDEPRAATELAELTGKHRHTVACAVGILESWGLAEQQTNGWVRGPEALESVAEALDAKAKASRRRARHELQRRAFREWKVSGEGQ